MGNATTKRGLFSNGTTPQRKQCLVEAGDASPKYIMEQLYGPWVVKYCSEWASKTLDCRGNSRWPEQGTFSLDLVEGLIDHLAARKNSTKAVQEQRKAALLWQLVSHEKKLDATDKELAHLRTTLKERNKAIKHLSQENKLCPVLERPPYEVVPPPEDDGRGGRSTIGLPASPKWPAPPPPPLLVPKLVPKLSTGSPGLSATGAAAKPSETEKGPIKQGTLASVMGCPDMSGGTQDVDKEGAHEEVSEAGVKEEQSLVHSDIPVTIGDTGITLTFSNFSAPEAFTFVASKPPGTKPGDTKPKLALRRLATHNAPGVKEEEQPNIERLRSATRRVNTREMCRMQRRDLTETDNDVMLNPMREVFRDPADVVARVHYPWAIWDLATLQERCPSAEKDINKFTEYFLNAVRAQEANWADTRVLLQKLLPPAKFRDLMALWIWGDDMLSVPTYPTRVDGTGSIAAGSAGDAARTTALVADIKSLFPVKPPLQCLETCTFSNDDTAYTFMDKTREAFTQIMGPGAADNESFRPFILSHYVNFLPTSVSHKIKATVGWESFSFATVCAHAAHHLKELGEVKKEKKERLLALQLLNLENVPANNNNNNFQNTIQNNQFQHYNSQRGNGGQRGAGSSNKGRWRTQRGLRGSSQNSNVCVRCGAFGHTARFCTAVMAAPGQFAPLGQSVQSVPMQAQPVQGQLAIGPPPNAQGLNVYAPPFFQTSNAQTQQTFTAPAPQQVVQQYRMA